jgi:hypothetical protein
MSGLKRWGISEIYDIKKYPFKLKKRNMQKPAKNIKEVDNIFKDLWNKRYGFGNKNKQPEKVWILPNKLNIRADWDNELNITINK